MEYVDVGVEDSGDQSAIAQTGLYGLRFLALVKHHVHVW